MPVETFDLPAELRARVNVIAGDPPRKTRYGRATFRYDAATSVVTFGKGDPIASGVVIAVTEIGSSSYQLTLEDDTTWIVLGGGCGCGS